MKIFYQFILLTFLLLTQVKSNNFNFNSQYTINFKQIEVIDLAVFYKTLVNKPVFIDVDLRGKTVNSDYYPNLSRYQTIEIFKKILNVNGISIIENNDTFYFILNK